MDQRYKTMLNKLFRIITAGRLRPQLLYCPEVYADLRNQIINDKQEYVPVDRSIVPRAKLMFDTGMWIRGQGPLPFRAQFPQYGEAWVEGSSKWYQCVVAGVLNYLAASFENSGTAPLPDLCQTPAGIHQEAFADLCRMLEMFFLSYNEPWLFNTPEGVAELLERSNQILASTKAPDINRLRASDRNCRLTARFVAILNSADGIEAKLLESSVISILDVKNGTSWTLNNFAVPAGFPKDLLATCNDCMEAAKYCVDYYAFEYCNDVAPRMRSLAHFFAAPAAS